MILISEVCGTSYFYPRPPRGGRRRAAHRYAYRCRISIHALREEGDAQELQERRGDGISIHALREEGDEGEVPYTYLVLEFLSTPSARRATPTPLLPLMVQKHFYPRPPRGGRHKGMDFQLKRLKFLSTPSARRATLSLIALVLLDGISIHALREEGDYSRGSLTKWRTNFYPRPPRGGRLVRLGAIRLHSIHFYPRPPRGGRRFVTVFTPSETRHFYPRPPRGGRP